MARARPEVLSLNGGEVDAEAISRSDIESYANKAAIYENAIPAVKGGLYRAPGTEFIGEALPAGDGFTVVRPWRFTRGQSFMVEYANDQLRLVYDGGYVQTAAGDATFDAGGWVDDSSGGAGTSEDAPTWPEGPDAPGGGPPTDWDPDPL